MICTCKKCKTNFFPDTAVSTDPSATSTVPPAPIICPVCGGTDIGVRQGWPELHYLVDLLAKGEIREAKAVYYNTTPEKVPELLDVVEHINTLLSSIPREISDKYFMEINAISVLLLDYCNGRYYENQKRRGVPKIETTGRKIWMKLVNLEQKLEHGIPGAGEVIMPWAYGENGKTTTTAAGNADTEESAPDAEGSVPDEAEVSALAEKLHCDPDYARSMLMYGKKASQKPEKAKKQLSPEQYKAALDFLTKSKYDTTTHMGLLLAEMWIDAEDNLGGFSREDLKTVLKTERATRAAEREIKLEWLPGVESTFRRIMPPISMPYPEIYYSNAYNFRETRDSILKQVGCTLRGQPDDSSLEYIHGENGGAILIRIDQLPQGMTQNHFAHFFWHELGHFYAINADSHNLERFNDPDRPPKEKNVKFKQRGYWFWSEFIAEAICNHVSYNVRANEPAYQQPEKIIWLVDVWSPILQKVQTLLDGMFYGSEIDEYSLAHYFATLLKDTDTILFVKAAEEGELIQSRHDTPSPPGSIDATCIDELDEPFQPIMIELKDWLEEKMKAERFWEIDEADIEWLGRRIYAMDKVWRELGE